MFTRKQYWNFGYQKRWGTPRIFVLYSTTLSIFQSVGGGKCEWWTEKDLEKKTCPIRGTIQASVCRNWFKKTKILCQKSQCPSRGSNRAPYEYKISVTATSPYSGRWHISSSLARRGMSFSISAIHYLKCLVSTECSAERDCLKQGFFTLFVPWTPLRVRWNLRTPSQKNVFKRVQRYTICTYVLQFIAQTITNETKNAKTPLSNIKKINM